MMKVYWWMGEYIPKQVRSVEHRYATVVGQKTGIERVVSVPCYLNFKKKGRDAFGER